MDDSPAGWGYPRSGPSTADPRSPSHSGPHQQAWAPQHQGPRRQARTPQAEPLSQAFHSGQLALFSLSSAGALPPHGPTLGDQRARLSLVPT